MAENPVLKEAKRKGIISSATNTTTGAAQTAAPSSGSSNPVVREFYGESAKARADSQKQIISKAQATPKTTDTKSSGTVGNALKGAAKSTASGWVNTGGTLLELLGKVGSALQSKKDAKQAAQDQQYLAQHEKELADALAAGDDEAAKWAQIKINQAKYRLKTNGDLGDYYDQVNKEAVDDVYQTADKLAESSAQDIQKAKQGKGAVGSFLVDAGVAGAQLAGDALTGGLAGTAVRTFGSGTQQARQNGGTLGEQVGYGLGSATVGVLTEKIANVAGPFKKAFGSGVLDKALGKVAAKPAGKLVMSALTEGGEEALESAVQPVLEKLTYNPDAQYDADWLADTLYSAAIGAVLGGGAGAVDVATSGTAQNPAKGSVVVKGAKPNEGKFTPTQENPAERPQTASAKVQTAPAKDPLLEALLGGKRVDHAKLSNEQYAAMSDRGDMGLDSAGKVYQVNPEQHIDRREVGNVSGMNAFQFDHPELKSYMQQAASALIADADLSLQFPMSRSYERGMQGNKVNQKAQASAHLRRAMDETGLSRNEIIDAAQRIINDKGQENVKAAKQVEIILDHMLTNGWQPMMGEAVAPNEAYLNAKSSIAGSQQTESEPITFADDGLGAANAGFAGDYNRLQNESSEFHPEGAYAARPVDVPTTDFDGRNIPKSASTVMGAQGTPDPAVLQLEQMIADGKLSFDTITDADSVAKAQNAVATKGFEGALEQYRQAVNTGVATKDNTTLGQQLLLQAMREGNTAYTAELLSLYTRNSTTAAQALQAQSIFRKLSPEGQLVAVQKAIASLNEKYGTEHEISQEDVADFLNAETTEERQEVERRIVQHAAEVVPGTFKAKFDTLRYLAMLGNPRTHIRNILGNTLFQVPVAVKNRVGAVAEGIAYTASGGKTERTKALFGPSPFGKLATEARADWVNAKDFLTQSNKYMEQTSLWNIEQEAHAFSDKNPLGHAVNRASDFNSDLLAAEDTAAKKIIYTQSLAGYLKANGCKSMADADAALLNKARTYAANEALRNTFNDTNAFSSAVSRLGAAHKSDNKAIRAAGYVVEGMIPFKKTPANILVRAEEYSPVGAAVGILNTVRAAKNNDTAAISKGLDQIAAGLTGTGMLALGVLAAGNGWVTGGEDEDKEQAAFDDLTGHQPYALELANGTSITLDWLAPEAIPFFMGVELFEQCEEGGLSWGELGSIVKNATAPMLEMSMLQSLNDTIDNAAYATFSGGSVAGSIITSALTNYATQVVPTIGGQLERTSEDVRMTTYTDKNSEISTDLQYTIGRASQKVPGWDYQQIPYIDAWGREEQTGSEEWRAFNNLVNPAYMSQVDVDRVESELQRLVDATGETGLFPQRAARYITTEDGRKDFTAEEYVSYAKELGNTSYELVKAGMETSAYGSMTDAEKAEYLSDLYSFAGASARASAGGKALTGWQLNAKTAQKDLGVSTAEYIALYQKHGSNLLSGNGYEKTKAAVNIGLTVDEYADMKSRIDANDNGSVSQAEAQTYLDQQDFSRGQKADLWSIINSSWKKNPYA